MSMGWKPGEGVGAKMSRRHRQKLKWSLTQETPKALPPSPPRTEEQAPPGVKVYGVALPPPSFQQAMMKTSRLDDMDDEDDYFDDQIVSTVIHFALFHLLIISLSSVPMSVFLLWIMKYIFNF